MKSSRRMHRAAGFRVGIENVFGGLPEWPKGADCKSAGYAFDGSNPSPSTGEALQRTGGEQRGSSSVGRASAFQAERRGFESRLPLPVEADERLWCRNVTTEGF